MPTALTLASNRLSRQMNVALRLPAQDNHLCTAFNRRGNRLKKHF
jgi:hypothetical protein